MADDKATIIDAQADVDGKLKGKDAHILGRFRGEVELSGRLVLGEGARVDAKVQVDAAEIAGEFKGEIKARTVTLAEKARVEGNVDAQVLDRPGGRAARRRHRHREEGGGGHTCPPGAAGPLILSELAARLGCAVRGNGSVEVARVAGIEEAGPGDLTFVASPKYAARLPHTRASAVIVPPGVETSLPSLLSDNPYLAFARAVAVLHPEARPAPGVHPAPRSTEAPSSGRALPWGPWRWWARARASERAPSCIPTSSSTRTR